jgi:DNA-binding NtrC family response regulator
VTPQPLRILIVDDEPDMCWALDNVLRQAGYTVVTTTSGVGALELISRAFYAAAFVDAKLPDLDGIELVSLIRRQSPRTGVVLISGFFYLEDTAVDERMKEGLIVGFVAKPFDLDQVRFLARRAAERALAGGESNDMHTGGGR